VRAESHPGEVTVVAVDAGNVEEVLALSAAPGQEAFVRPVSWYVARSAYEQVWTPVAFRAAGKIVGFAEWAYDPEDGTYCIGGVVIDAARQGQGLGRQAILALVHVLRQRPDCGPIALSVAADNRRARELYARLGFSETGAEVDDELVMVLPAGHNAP
jgi:diamine N-acetyltransferase